MTVVAIHQPNFMPWSGYFSKISNSDVFVFLDDVKCSKNSFLNRNRFSTNESWFWLGIPIPKISYGKDINEVFFEGKHLTKHIKYFEMSHLRKTKEPELIQEIIDTCSLFSKKDTVSISDFNTVYTKMVCDFLSIKTPMIKSSDLKIDKSKKKQALVIEIVKNLGGTCYLSGKGASDYQNKDDFLKDEISLKYTEFSPQRHDFIGGQCMSIVDCFLREKRDIVLSRL
tara:strand:- start:2161 stop:2841 length:681 start_codon:yes stop_codon:yes gene_type:complete